MPFDIQKIRNQLRNKLSNRPQDPFEFRPPKAKKDETIKIRFYVLQPLVKGEKCFGGIASRSMDDLFALKHGNHWVNNKPHACPRINSDEPCELCDAGFDMLRETDDKDKRRAIIQNWLGQSVYAVNIYVPNIQSNPEPLRGKVMFFNAPKTCFDQWYAAVNRDSGGDAADPEAYGVFYDPEAAYLYQLEIVINGNNNSYKTSKFLAQMGAHPIARTKDGNPDAKRIQAILDQRHDLWTKVETPNPDKIRKLANAMLHGTDTEEVTEGTTAPAAPAAPRKPAAAAARPAARPRPQPEPEPEPEPELEPEGAGDDTLEEELPGNGEVLEQEAEVEAPPPPPKKPAATTKAAPARPTAAAKAPASPTSRATAAKAPASPTSRATAAAKAPAKAPAKGKAATADAEDDNEIDRLLGELTPTEDSE